MGLRRTLKKLLKYEEKDPFLNDSYSQEGEDMILARVLEGRQNGYFVDVGAHHPSRFSNTYRFYRQGWRGINIDAMPGGMELFKKMRPLDVNLEIPVSDKTEVLPFYIFNETALNTFSKEVADERNNKKGYFIEKVVNIETQSLQSILDKYLPTGQEIDFLSIDAEGFDFQILKSNNWAKYRPQIVLIESDLDYEDLIKSEVDIFMREQGYKFYAKTARTFFYKNSVNTLY